MSTCREIRRKAWSLMTNKWVFRLLAVGGALSVVYAVVNRLVMTAFANLGIMMMGEYVVKCAQAKANGLTYALPTARAWFWMVGGEVFSLFVSFVFLGIMSFGVLRTCFKAEADDGRRWFKDAFAGFARPLELAWLFFCQMAAFAFCLFLGAVVCALWLALVVWSSERLGGRAGVSLLFTGYAAALGIILLFWVWATYRYRLAWYLKVEHPDWSAISCVVKGRRLIDGYKWKSFGLDCSFAGWFLLALAAIMGVSFLFMFVKTLNPAPSFAAVLALAFLLAAFLGCYYAIFRIGMTVVLARILLYREILAEKSL